MLARLFRCCALRRCAGSGVAELLLADCLPAQIPSWLLFIERPQSQPSTRQSCRAHWWRIWDVWPPSHYYARAALPGLRRALSAVTRCVWIVGVRPQGGHDERGGVRGAGWQSTVGKGARARVPVCVSVPSGGRLCYVMLLAWGVCGGVTGGAIVRRWAVWDGGSGGCGAQSGNHGLHRRTVWLGKGRPCVVIGFR